MKFSENQNPEGFPENQNPEGNPVSFLRQAIWLFVGCLLGCAAVLPYLSRLQGDTLKEVAEAQGMSLETLVAIAVAQQVVLLLVTITLGLLATRKIGIRLPVFDALARREPIFPHFERFWKPAVMWGGGLGAVVLGLTFAFEPHMPENFLALQEEMIWWEGLLASFYGGFNEEVLTRLFLLGVIAFVLKFFFARSAQEPPVAIFWAANVFAALAFGALHLGPVAGVIDITPVVIVYALLLNGILGLSFGWLFWKFGLAAAMLAHFSTDIVLHVLPHLFGG